MKMLARKQPRNRQTETQLSFVEPLGLRLDGAIKIASTTKACWESGRSLVKALSSLTRRSNLVSKSSDYFSTDECLIMNRNWGLGKIRVEFKTVSDHHRCHSTGADFCPRTCMEIVRCRSMINLSSFHCFAVERPIRVFFRCFSLVFFFCKSMRAGGKKTQNAEKNTMLEYAIPTLTNMNTHKSDTLPGTLHIPLQWGKI